MCLIITKPKGTPFDNFLIDAIFQAHAYNRDGLGIAIKKPEGVYLKKGLFDASIIAEFIEKHNVDENDEVLFHARIRTAGSVIKENCHPFILNRDLIDETETFLPSEYESNAKNIKSISNEILMAHNGGMGYEKIWHDKSDTYHVALNPFSLLPVKIMFRQYPKEFEKYFVDKKISGSRLAFMSVRPDAEMKYYGNWHDYEGYRFSHGGHARKRTTSIASINNTIERNLALILNNKSDEVEIRDLSILDTAFAKNDCELFNSFDELVKIAKDDAFSIMQITYVPNTKLPERVTVVRVGEGILSSRFCFDLPYSKFKEYFRIKERFSVDTFENYLDKTLSSEQVFEFKKLYSITGIPDDKFRMIEDYNNDEMIQIENFDNIEILRFDPMTSDYIVNIFTSDQNYYEVEIERKELLKLNLKLCEFQVEDLDRSRELTNNPLYTILETTDISKSVFKELIKCMKNGRKFKYNGISYKNITNDDIIEFLDETQFAEKDIEYQSLKKMRLVV